MPSQSAALRQPAAHPADAFAAAWGEATTLDLIAAAADTFAGRIALVSSFGTESAVLLDLVAQVNPALPVVFLDTGKLFGETLRYRDRLVSRLGLTDVRVIRPDPAAVAAADPDGILWTQAPDRCCAVRKVEPLARALAPFDAWISGRKRFQAATRAALPRVEADGARVKINPLADWSRDALDRAFTDRDLPRHPLEEDGFLSIGCMPCTDRVAPGEDVRAGRWRHAADKTECGIHLPFSAAAPRSV
ncbi:phosphoadenylyl-sulfate reductase [Caenispirillum bisanense]|uniref:phosphoadenylyl-sulfate reductase n=1 Tax=Caenispirillum bisanense TaxID=414052 RepID=UPI0031DE3108